ncbi:MAG: polysaccharide deacetylase family protein [Candidatus Limivicinus sp.]|nr:polysaccharide deacetylase family protein [Clostridiales bacterium]MDY6132055.1 polysaccharide deacetylase family protein [Candidatus Limivicinus sp.]
MKNRTTLFLAVMLLLAAFLVCGCGKAAQEPVSTPEPTPIPTPEPSPEPELPQGDAVTVEGVSLQSGSIVYNDSLYVRFQEFAEALGAELSEEDGILSFTWQDAAVGCKPGNPALYIRGEAVALRTPVKTYRNECYVPVEPLCGLLHIGMFYDEEYAHLYCTVGAGDWQIPAGYKVPVFMYHGVTDYTWGSAELFVSPSVLEEQLRYLVENGYDPIWFEDLREVEKYDKPVILTFDDGYQDNYTDLFPLLQKYNVKATIFVITGWLGGEKYLTPEQVTEMSQSGLVSIQSHTWSHKDMDTLPAEAQREQMSQSKLAILRLTGKEPAVLCYPRGLASHVTLELLPEYYNFGVKMNGSVYYTGDDPRVVTRYYVTRGTSVESFANMLKK